VATLAQEASLGATKDLLKQEEFARSNAERVFQDGLRRTYNQAHMDRLQTELDSIGLRIANYYLTITRITAQLQSDQEKVNSKRKLFDQVRQFGQPIESADWLTKRLWLQLLQVWVYVYRKGHYDAGEGHRWRVWGVENMRDLVKLYNGVDVEGLSL